MYLFFVYNNIIISLRQRRSISINAESFEIECMIIDHHDFRHSGGKTKRCSEEYEGGEVFGPLAGPGDGCAGQPGDFLQDC